MNPRTRLSAAVAGLLLLATPAFAESAVAYHPTSLGEAILSTLVFGLIGIVLAIIGFKLFDLITPFNLEKEICENKNVAVGILGGAIVLGICWIVAAAMS